jgi:predicted ester cyclase
MAGIIAWICTRLGRAAPAHAQSDTRERDKWREETTRFPGCYSWLLNSIPSDLQQDLMKTGANAVMKTDLSDIYRGYIACLNKQDWPKLGQFVHDDACYNGKRIGLSGYREMLERDFREIPDLYFNIQLLISDPPRIASRLGFDCRPRGKFLGLDVNGKRISFAENVFYEFQGEKIAIVWSVIDKAAIETQL